jgi:hypothetical protein
MWQQHIGYLNREYGIGWQDWIIVSLQIGFIVALWPMFRKDAHRPDFWSAVMTAAFVTIFVYVYATMEFWRTVFFTSILALEWWALAILQWPKRQ